MKTGMRSVSKLQVFVKLFSNTAPSQTAKGRFHEGMYVWRVTKPNLGGGSFMPVRCPDFDGPQQATLGRGQSLWTVP